MTDPQANCPQAGPAGAVIASVDGGATLGCSGGNVCESFCALEILACGSMDAPLPGNPKDAANNPLYQYRNTADCLSACNVGFDKTHPYSTLAMGDSLACRLRQATLASISVTVDGAAHCAATGATPTGPCAGAASP
jgi:hypothetical protein